MTVSDGAGHRPLQILQIPNYDLPSYHEVTCDTQSDLGIHSSGSDMSETRNNSGLMEPPTSYAAFKAGLGMGDPNAGIHSLASGIAKPKKKITQPKKPAKAKKT